MKKTLLSFGYKEEVVKACKRLGMDIVSLVDPWDKPEYLPACEEGESRVFTQDNTKNELILSALAREGKLSFESVISPFETTLVSSSFLGGVVSKPFIDPMVAIAFRDKYYQKKLLRGTVAVAQSWHIDDVAKMNTSEDYPYPIIFKPVAGAGTAHTYKVHDQGELEKIAAKHVEDTSLPQSMVIEEFIEGEEWHVDGWMSKGELQLFAISKYGAPLINIQKGALVQSITLRPEAHKDLYSRLDAFLSKALKTLGLKDGVFHLELFYNEETDEITFSECGARIGGGMIAQKFKHMFNIDIVEVLIKLSIGEKVTVDQTAGTTEYTGWVYLPSISPDVKELPSIPSMKEQPGVVEVHYNWKPGQKMPDTRLSTVQRTGMVLVSGESEQQVNVRMKNIVQYFVSMTSAVPS